MKSIIEGEKRYEFRKAIFRNRSVHRVFIYASAPVKRIVARFEISTILEDHPTAIWEKVHDNAGIDETEFFSYFAGRERGYAIGIGNLREFDTPVDPREGNPGFVPPQSYCYVDGLPAAE